MLELFQGTSSIDILNVIAYGVAFVMAMLIALSFHEFAHAFVAKTQGDYTAVAMKRCTLAPLAHFDAIGFLCLLLLGFGWAKPVPVDSRNFKNGRKSAFLVAIAGIVTNLLLAIVFSFIFVLIYKINPNFYNTNFYGLMLGYFLQYSIMLNLSFALFNLLPLYPFDGYRIIDSLSRFENQFLVFMKRYSNAIYIICLITGVFSAFLSFGVNGLGTCLISLFELILGVA